ncbi:monocarboxylate transporter 10-like [Antedon mediterranea]|uniref:monocarboxylate transporter 10-like n=1 Tax=Antedon mediterranea TaxID=105859 RepID=UPI003AF75531
MESLTKKEEAELPHISHGFLKRIHEHWGWVVTIGVSVVWFLIIGSHYVYALTFISLQNDFDASATLIGLIGSVYLSLGCCLSPVTSWLQRHYSHRTISILAILITTVSYVVSSFMQSLVILVFTFGVLSGIAYNFVYTSLHHILVCYFPSKRCRAPIAIANVGPTIAMLCLSPIIEKLLSLYGWRWTLRIQGLVICVFGLLACTVFKKPPVWKKSEKQEEKKSHGHSGYLTAVLKLPETWIFSLATFLTGVASTFLYVYIGSYIVSKGLTEEQSSLGMTACGCGSLVACFIGAVVIDRTSFPTIYLLPVLSVLTSLTFIILIWVHTLVPVITMCIVVGLLRTGYNILILPPAVELLGTARALEAGTLSISSLGAGYIVGSYISGKMFDAFGSYDIALYICSGIYLAAAMLALMAPIYQRIFARDRYMVDRKFTDLQNTENLQVPNVQYEYLLIERESVI